MSALRWFLVATVALQVVAGGELPHHLRHNQHHLRRHLLRPDDPESASLLRLMQRAVVDKSKGHTEGAQPIGTGTTPANHTAQFARPEAAALTLGNDTQAEEANSSHHGEHHHGEDHGKHQHGEHHDDHHDDHHEGIHVASWNWEYVQAPFIYTFFVVLAGLCKVGFHHADFLSSLLPESCLLILLGSLVGGIVYLTGAHDMIPKFESRTFFLFLLPPIMLESAYSLHDRAFAENLGTVLLYAVVGTLINCFTIGPTLCGLAKLGAMGNFSIEVVDALVFSALISAVDPVAVLAIFQEVGVNKDLYFLVFGESLLNDAVTVVLYTMMVAFTTMETITVDQIGLGVAAFFCVSVGGLFIGVIFGILTALVTKHTEEVRVVEPLAMLGMAYLSYLTAEMVHFSGIISIIGCGLVQAQYAISNISSKSYTTVKYFSKMLSATCDCIIFLFLGMVLINDEHIWHTGFILWSLFLCLLFRFSSVFSLTFIVNRIEKIRYIDYEEQFIMAYGGLRGAVCFSLVIMLNDKTIPSKNLFVTTTLVIILFTVFVQGGTIKPLVKWLEIQSHKEGYLSLTCEINTNLINHVMGGIEEIAGERGENYLKLLLYRYDEKYLRKWLQRSTTDNSSLCRVYEKLAIQDHYAHLYGPAAQKDSEKQMKVQSTCAPVLMDDSVIAPLVAPEEKLPTALPTPQKPALAKQPSMKSPSNVFGPSMFGGVKPKGKVSAIAQSIVGVGQTVASPLMVDTARAAQTLRKALRENYFNKFHQKYNPNLIRDDQQELGEQLRLRRLRARRLTMAALSPATSIQSSRTDLSQSQDEVELRGLGPAVGASLADRSRSASLATTTELLVERARQRRKQNMCKAHTVEVDGGLNLGSPPLASKRVGFIRNGAVEGAGATSEKAVQRHSTGDLELKPFALDPISESENGDDEKGDEGASRQLLSSENTSPGGTGGGSIGGGSAGASSPLSPASISLTFPSGNNPGSLGGSSPISPGVFTLGSPGINNRSSLDGNSPSASGSSIPTGNNPGNETTNDNANSRNDNRRSVGNNNTTIIGLNEEDDEEHTDERSPFIESSDTLERRRNRLSKERNVEVDDSETTV